MDTIRLVDEGDNAMLSEAFSNHISRNDEVSWRFKEVFKRLLYEYIEYFPNNLEHSEINSDLKKSFIFACFENLVLLFQLLTLGQPYLLYQDSSRFQMFYLFINTSRPDLILASLTFYTFAFILQCCIVFILSNVFLINVYKGIKPSGTKRWIVYCTLLADRILRRYLYIPVLVGFLTSIKFNIFHASGSVYFYSYDVSVLQNYVVSLISYPLLILTLLNVSLFSLIDNQEKGCNSRSHSRVILLETWCIFICVINQVFLIENHTKTQVTIQMLIGVYLTYCFGKYLPYNYPAMNIVKLNTYLTFTWNAFVNLMNSNSGSAGSTVLITIITLPILYIFSHYIIKWRYGYIERLQFTQLHCPYISEIQIRAKISALTLLTKDEKEEEAEDLRNHIKRMFNFMQNSFGTEALVACWNARYLFEMEKDEELAKIKLSKVHYLPFSLDGYYLAFRYEKTFNALSNTYSEHLDYLKFREIYQTVKSEDALISKLQLEFWIELDKGTPRISRLKRVANKMKRAVATILKHGDKLVSEYPQNIQALYLYSTFLSEVYNDHERGQDLFQKYSYLKSSAVESFSLFDERMGIMIVSGDGNNTGKIEYLNKEASSILDIPAETAISLNVAQFLPYPINDYKYHNECMMNFIKNTPKTQVPLPHNSFIVNQKGFLVNITFDGKCVAYNSLVFFLAALKRNDDLGEAALISSDGVIQIHTQYFPKLLDIKETSIIGYSLMTILPEITSIKFTQQNGMKFTVNKIRLWLNIEEIQVKSVTFRLVILKIDRADSFEPEPENMFRLSKWLSDENMSGQSRVSFDVPYRKKTSKLNSLPKDKNNSDSKVGSNPASTGNLWTHTIDNSALDKNMKNTVLKSIKMLKISILISKCAAFVGMLGIILLLFIYKNEAQMEKFSSINHTMVYVQKLALHSKLMTLNAGFDNISEDIKAFKDLIDNFKDNNEFSDRDYSKLKVLYWETRFGEYYNSNDYLLQVLLNLYDSAISIQNTPELNTQPEGFYLKRNGEGEALLSFNATTYDIKKQLIESTKEVIIKINLLSLSSILMNLVALVLLIIPSLVTIERAQRKIWRFYFNLTSSVINDLKQRAEKRLVKFHNFKAKEPIPINTLETKNKKAIAIDKIWYKPILHLLFYYSFLAGFAMYYQFDFISNIKSDLYKQPEIIYWDNQRLLGVQSLLYWRLEENQPSENLLWNSKQRQQMIIDLLYNSEKEIHSLLNSKDSEEYELTYNSAGTGLLSFGIHPSILYFISSDLQDFNISSQISVMKQILEKCEELRDIHQDSFRSNLSRSIDTGTAISSMFCVIILFLYIVYYLPLCRNLQNEILDCWKFTKLIPPEVSVNFIFQNKRSITQVK